MTFGNKYSRFLPVCKEQNIPQKKEINWKERSAAKKSLEAFSSMARERWYTEREVAI
jgi:hypothetical protein